MPLLIATLLPPASTLSWLDLTLPPLCLCSALLLHIALNPEECLIAQRAHLYRMRTNHARFLPKQSKHAFSYSTINVGVDLDALDAGCLDLGRWFAYHRSRWSLFALNPTMFSSLPTSDAEKPAAVRVRKHLRERGVADLDMCHIYTVAMPSYLGFAGINPLVTHYCYDQDWANLRCVVLEVHNTFEERHIYVLKVGEGEDARIARGFRHQWTFRRAFHVSPFNDRSGFYQVSVVEPLCIKSTDPAYNMKILLLTPEGDKKLMATLSGSGNTLSDGSILRAAFSHPFSLLLTSARILYQASILHYFKRLNVFARPEPFVGQQQSRNAVHSEAHTGSIHWQQPSRDQLFLRMTFERALALRLQSHPELQVVLQPADFTQPSSTIPASRSNPTSVIHISVHSFSAFQELLILASPHSALQAGKVNGTWSTDQPDQLLQLLASPSANTQSISAKACRRLRSSYHRLRAGQHPASATHWSNEVASWRLFTSLLSYVCLDLLAYAVFKLFKAEFVREQSPWQMWDQSRVGPPQLGATKGQLP